MSIVQKFLELWANAGDTTDPGDVKRANGWEVGERPPAEWFNYLSQETETVVNELSDAVTHARGGHPPGSHLNIGRRNQMTASTQWQRPATANKTSLSAFTQGIASSAVGWDSVKRRPILFYYERSSSTGKLYAIDCYDYDQILDDQPYELSYTASFSIDHSMSFTPMCAADGYLYIILRDVATLKCYLQKYEIANWTGDPVASTEWFTSSGVMIDMCEANDDTLVTVQFDSSDYYTVYTIGKDGTGINSITSASAHWDYSYAPMRNIRSDGEYIYFCAMRYPGASTDLALVYTDIDLSATNYIAINTDNDGNTTAFDLVCLGGSRVAILVNNNAGGDDSSNLSLYVFYESAGGHLSGPYILTNDLDVAYHQAALGFDGVNLYAFYFTKVTTSQYSAFVYDSIDANVFSYFDNGYDDTPIFHHGVHHWVELPTITAEDLTSVDSNRYFILTDFDGRDMWVTYCNMASPTVFRIPAIGSRHPIPYMPYTPYSPPE